MSHKVYDDRAIGPLGEHDAHLLRAICQYVRPSVAIEYGGLLGHSLEVMAPHCDLVISVDDNCGGQLRETAAKFKNAQVVKSKMQDYDPRMHTFHVDLVFMDASHLLPDSVQAFDNVEPLLTGHALVLVHDTGDWYSGPDPLPPQWEAWKEHRARFLTEDRAFVKYLRELGWSDVTFESSRHLRHGITVLKRPTW